MTDITALLPLSIPLAGALTTMLLEVFLKRRDKSYLAYLSIIFLLGNILMSFRCWGKDYTYFGRMLHWDNPSLVFSMLLNLAVVFVVLISISYISRQGANHGEFYSLLLFALTGALIMVSTADLLVIFLGLEVLSISSYALAGIKRSDDRSSEAAVKYFLLGSFAAAFLIYGIALLYGAFHATGLQQILHDFQSASGPPWMALLGLGFVLIGFGFKIALIPFHMWTPDVYQGAPTPVTAFFSVVPKAVGFAVLLRFFRPDWPALLESPIIVGILTGLAVLTMVGGNLLALRQTDVKRILAYSSIAHAGYLLVAIIARDAAALIFYLIVYLFMNVGAFSAVIVMSRDGHEYTELEDYAGIGFRYPWLGACFAVFLFSLAGFPPTGGFLAKFYVFAAGVREGLIPLVVIAVLASLISVYYYLRIIVVMYMRPPSPNLVINLKNQALFLVLFLCLYGVLRMGLFPGNILLFIKQAVLSIAAF